MFGDFLDTFLTLRAGRPGNTFLRHFGDFGARGCGDSCGDCNRRPHVKVEGDGSEATREAGRQCRRARGEKSSSQWRLDWTPRVPRPAQGEEHGSEGPQKPSPGGPTIHTAERNVYGQERPTNSSPGRRRGWLHQLVHEEHGAGLCQHGQPPAQPRLRDVEHRDGQDAPDPRPIGRRLHAV